MAHAIQGIIFRFNKSCLFGILQSYEWLYGMTTTHNFGVELTLYRLSSLHLRHQCSDFILAETSVNYPQQTICLLRRMVCTGSKFLNFNCSISRIKPLPVCWHGYQWHLGCVCECLCFCFQN